jgi:hypothetical protein
MYQQRLRNLAIEQRDELKRQNEELLAEMRRFLPLIERLEANPSLWVDLTSGLGIATANGYRAAITKAMEAAGEICN